MISETQETRSTAKPDWFELSEPEKQRHTYWTCGGTDLRPWWRKWFLRGTRGWRRVYHSKEEAEADASLPCKHWRWNGKPARPCNLPDVMFRARQKGDLGVACTAFRNGRFEFVKKWPIGEPLVNESAGRDQEEGNEK